jgi:hypothetical protein
MIVGPGLHLTYCSNIHPGEEWDEVSATLTETLPRVRTLLGHRGPMAIGLRLSARAAAALSRPDRLDTFRGFLRDGDYYVPTINGFPYGAFHGTRVKERVYQPDWRDPARLAYSNALAALLTKLLAESPDVEGSISTVPGAFRPALDGETDARAIAAAMLEHVAHLKRLREASGVTIGLAIEPEPACMIETVDDAVEFFERWLFDETEISRVARARDLSIDRDDVRRHLGLCFDVCHMAVEFEEPGPALTRLEAAGIRVLKIQLSAALRVVEPHRPNRLDALRRFAEDTYLHQVVQRRGSGLVRFVDLPAALDDAARNSPEPDDEWRVHFHVPIFLEHAGPFRTTQPELVRTLARMRPHAWTGCFEVETYTWDVLPAELRKEDLGAAIARELSWVQATLRS